MKTLDQKIAHIHRDPSGSKDFILADAKDADMATGLAATGVDPVTGKRRTLADYREQIRQVIGQAKVDIVLMSASTNDLLTIQERLFDGTAITPAARANDTTDIHLPAGGTYGAEPSRPFRTATLEQIQSGKVDPTPAERKLGADLGLYSITPNNKLEFDYPTVQAYKDFRVEAERVGFRHFLEVFDPNACGNHCPADLGRFINDLIVRTLAGVPRAGRPVFLKIVYHGPKAMEDLATYDPHLVPGILGGASGTTYDAFKMLADAKKYGARAALYGRKINNAEHQLTFISFLRLLADGQITAEEAVRAYHGELQKLGIKPIRSLADDQQLTTQSMSYAAGGAGTKPKKSDAAEAKSAQQSLAVSPQTRSGSTVSQTDNRVSKTTVLRSPSGSSLPSAKPQATSKPIVRTSDAPKGVSGGSRVRVTFGGGASGTPSARVTVSGDASPSQPAAPAAAVAKRTGGSDLPRTSNGSLDFKSMTPAQKVQAARQRLKAEIARDQAG